MVNRDVLEQYLADLYQFDKFEDYAHNGIQVEGREQIENVVFGVSFNRPLLDAAIEREADAIIVHHGFFGRDHFVLKAHRKEAVRMLLLHNINLIGIHLPMDAHPELGHNALLLEALKAEMSQPLNVGFLGLNSAGLSVEQILDRYDEMLHPEREGEEGRKSMPHGLMNDDFSYFQRYGFSVLKNGPDIPHKIAVISGGGASDYEQAIFMGVDTFICGEMKEHIPALSLESETNFINLGHYYSETPGIRKLLQRLQGEFKINGEYVEIANVI